MKIKQGYHEFEPEQLGWPGLNAFKEPLSNGFWGCRFLGEMILTYLPPRRPENMDSVSRLRLPDPPLANTYYWLNRRCAEWPDKPICTKTEFISYMAYAWENSHQYHPINRLILPRIGGIGGIYNLTQRAEWRLWCTWASLAMGNYIMTLLYEMTDGRLMSMFDPELDKQGTDFLLWGITAQPLRCSVQVDTPRNRGLVTDREERQRWKGFIIPTVQFWFPPTAHHGLPSWLLIAGQLVSTLKRLDIMIPSWIDKHRQEEIPVPPFMDA